MSEEYFLQKCILAAEDAKGSYSMMANLALEEQAKQMYTDMVLDIGKHLNSLNGRLNFLKQEKTQAK